MGETHQQALLDAALAERKSRTMSYIFSRPEISSFQPQDLRDASLHYFQSSGKSLRPSILMFACGAVGGDEQLALPAAAAVEVYHTWTLVHDDIIDRDIRRRGQATVHEEFRCRAETKLGYSAAEAAHYGLSIAILAGDLLQGWCTSLLGDLASQSGCDPHLALGLVKDLMLVTQARLVAGQTLDIQFEQAPVEDLLESDILAVLSGKTAALFEFCGRAGALIGLGNPKADHLSIAALSNFAGLCGLAFQLQDDILGVTGDESKLGKPVGSDIREGKKTLIVHHALRNANASQRAIILRALGNSNASPDDARRAVSSLSETGSIEYAREMASAYIRQARERLNIIPSSKYKDLLLAWANLMVNRSS